MLCVVVAPASLVLQPVSLCEHDVAQQALVKKRWSEKGMKARRAWRAKLITLLAPTLASSNHVFTLLSARVAASIAEERYKIGAAETNGQRKDCRKVPPGL